MPPPQVGVVTVQPRALALRTELPGRVEALRVAQVRARVNGVVLKRLFTRRQRRQGGPGAVPDRPGAVPGRARQRRRPRWPRRRPTCAHGQPSWPSATSRWPKPRPSASRSTINAEAARKQAEADVAAGQAARADRAAQSRLRAPSRRRSPGRIGRAAVTEGALVGAGRGTPLATDPADRHRLRQLHAAQCRGAAPAQALASGQRSAPGRQRRRRGAHRARRRQRAARARASCCSPTWRSIPVGPGDAARRSAQPRGLLLPGMYVRVRLAQAELPAARSLVPQQAVTRMRQGDNVLVVGADGKPQPRQRSSSALAQGNDWIVLEGLKAGERVIVEGFQKMRCPARRSSRCRGRQRQPAGGASASRRRRAPAAAQRGKPAEGTSRAWHASSSTARSSRG